MIKIKQFIDQSFSSSVFEFFNYLVLTVIEFTLSVIFIFLVAQIQFKVMAILSRQQNINGNYLNVRCQNNVKITSFSLFC